MPFEFDPKITLGDLLSFAGLLATAVGLFFAWWQLRKDQIASRAEFIVTLFGQYTADPEIQQILYDIEYNQFRYSSDFHGSETEKRLDRLLGYFEKIAALYLMKSVTAQDLEFVRYDFLRVYENSKVQRYFATLDKLPDVAGVAGGNFSHFRQIGARLQSKAKQEAPDRVTGWQCFQEEVQKLKSDEKAGSGNLIEDNNPGTRP